MESWKKSYHTSGKKCAVHSDSKKKTRGGFVPGNVKGAVAAFLGADDPWVCENCAENLISGLQRMGHLAPSSAAESSSGASAAAADVGSGEGGAKRAAGNSAFAGTATKRLHTEDATAAAPAASVPPSLEQQARQAQQYFASTEEATILTHLYKGRGWIADDKWRVAKLMLKSLFRRSRRTSNALALLSARGAASKLEDRAADILELLFRLEGESDLPALPVGGAGGVVRLAPPGTGLAKAASATGLLLDAGVTTTSAAAAAAPRTPKELLTTSETLPDEDMGDDDDGGGGVGDGGGAQASQGSNISAGLSPERVEKPPPPPVAPPGVVALLEAVLLHRRLGRNGGVLRLLVERAKDGEVRRGILLDAWENSEADRSCRSIERDHTFRPLNIMEHTIGPHS